MVEGGMKCIKYLLFAFNLIFFIVGLALIALGIVIQTMFKDYVDFFETGALSAPAILVIVVGVIILLLGFLGCCGAVKENYCMVMTFAVLMFIIFILEVAAAIAAFALRGTIEKVVVDKLDSTMAQYVKHNDSVVHRVWDEIQKDRQCCGPNQTSDWAPHFKDMVSKYPDSCCKEFKVGCAMAEEPTWTTGCVPAVEDWLLGNIWKIGGVGIAFAVVQIIGIVFACCLARSIKGGYEVA